MTVLYGAHFSRRTVVEAMASTGAQVAQVFVGSPKAWRSPRIPEQEIEAWKTRDFPVYVHSSYLVNPASSSEDFRQKTIKSLSEQFAAASSIGASGVVVHAGHAGGENVQVALNRWSESMKAIDLHGVKLLIENTAGGNAAPGRSVDGLLRLWEVLGDYSPELCFDTCHAWAGNMLDERLEPQEAFLTAIERLKSEGIVIGLTHLNGSLDARNSGRDHHSNLTESLYPFELLKLVAETIGAPAILETPGPLSVLQSELALLKK